jgi:hypothetical protein
MMKRIFLSLCLLIGMGGAGGAADTTPPSITLGLADPANMGSVLPMPANNIVTPDARGLVRFRARITDAGSGVRNVIMEVPNTTASIYNSPTPRTFIGASWYVRNVANGTQKRVTVAAWDYAGKKASVVVTVTLRK